MDTWPVKDPGESVILGFDMSSNLPTGVLLNGTISVVVTVREGTDPNPTAILNGAAGLDSTQTKVAQPVTQGLDGVLYEVKATAATTSPDIVLVKAGALPVSNPK